jgi:hypothetical protein
MPEDGRRYVARGLVKVRVMNEGQGLPASHNSMTDGGSRVYISGPGIAWR